LGVIDTEKAAEVTGARFAYLKGDLVLMQFALVQYTFSILTDKNVLKEIANKVSLNISDNIFKPVVPPALVSMKVMGKMARLEPMDDRYCFPDDQLCLVGSAEHTLGPLHMDETISADNLPLRYIGYSTAFRREAGTYGKDTKGILRLHQFDKLEMESFSLAKDGQAEQDLFVAIQEYLVSSLGLPYQVVLKCTGDMGGPDARAVDIETWLPGEDTYRETHTADYMTDYQSRRLRTRTINSSGEKEFVHMNDGTAFAIGRIIIAIMENYQQEDGTIKVPEVLIPYMGRKVINDNSN
jgi:seryl-tRNA synthetase